MARQLTERQQAVYDMIRDLIVQRGYGPTVREIGEQFGIKSPNGVMCHLRALERKGLITRSPNKSRAIELTQAADRSGHALPMAGMVAAGPTTLAFEQNERIDFSEMLFKDDRFILRVSGDSMINAHIADGDYVVIQKQETAAAGDMVVAQTPEGEARRNDEDFAYVAAWEFKGAGETPDLHKEELDFEYVKLTQRSYK